MQFFVGLVNARGLSLRLLVVVLAIGVAGCERDSGPLTMGLLKEVSPLPNPLDSPYADCMQVVHLQDIRDWPSDLPTPPEEGVLLIWPGFVDRKLTASASLIAGDAVTLQPVAMTAIDEELRSTQRVDTLEGFTLPMYFAREVEHIRDFRDPKEKIEAPRAAAVVPSLAEILQAPFERKLNADRQKIIAERVAALERMAGEHGGWEAWSAATHPFYYDLRKSLAASKASGLRHGHHVFERTYNHRFTDLLRLEEPPALKMLVALDRELARKGIDLLVVPFPLKEEINASLFSDVGPAEGSLSPARLQCMHWLLKYDVEVVDLAPALREARDFRPWLYYDFDDHHPAQGGIELAAEVIAKRLQRYKFKPVYKGLSRQLIEFEMPATYMKRFQMRGEVTSYPARQVVQSHGGFLPRSDKQSPVLLIGDSFTRVPMLYGVGHAGLREQIAFESGIFPRSMSIYGSAARIMRNLRREGPDYLEGVKVCVFVFAQYPMFETVDDDGRLQPSPKAEQWEVAPLP